MRRRIVGLGVAEQVSDVEILVGAAPVVRGVATDEAAHPRPASTSRRSAATTPSATTDAKGAFVLEGLSPGRYS